MQVVNEKESHLDGLGVLLEDMRKYLHIVEQGCRDFSTQFQQADNSLPLISLTQMIEGLGYYQKLLKSSAVLLNINLAEFLYENSSISSLIDQLSKIFTEILEAVENKDYTLVTDLIEYDLLSAISISQEFLVIVQKRCEERVI
ncbi:hypothetical protein SAMN04515679_0920 [Pelosinus fermentans]|uniref:hypothetical protein n=1 Tax=Pelosinus fermentans TaxID=365349 RepID=UPI0002685EA6|nr:hypothetical protein [Pelosinus fermentans]OAM92849.1 hypothetical protein FR7_00865 [Pelosinus fermentans DSM 17108]SDQ58830.1 hypothetical protein SAMN04515679_0920 [Pelosinus fermentans]